MSFFEHLDELRAHLIRAILGVVVAAIFVFASTDFVFRHILFAPVKSDFATYQALCWLSEKMGTDVLCFSPRNIEIKTFEMGEAFLLHIQVCIFGGLILAFPYVFWEMWRFVKPGLYTNERQATKWVVLVCSLLFALGVLFGYYILAPFSINFLVNYDLPVVNETGNFLKVSSYLGYLIMFTLPMGLTFELPIVVYYLAKIGIMSPEFMRTYRRHAIVIILIVAAVITPPDVISQTIVGLPLYILYEISIGIAARTYKPEEQA